HTVGVTGSSPVSPTSYEMKAVTDTGRSEERGLLRMAIRSRVAPDAVIWNATMPDTVTGDTQKKL
ncbi:MAG: hypothetical protein IKB76_06445, partial [Kiritimatiellae bacterium]|nr:hypothetical protein [Kiritimatiellia bacterium]